MIPANLQRALLSFLKSENSIPAFQPISGGCINHAGRLSTSSGNYFIKWNLADKFPGMFQAEAKGLQLLANSQTMRTPSVVVQGEADQYQFLLFEFIETTTATTSFWNIFGEQLARLHSTTNAQFGLEDNNYIGSLPQSNTWNSSYTTFFIHQRLLPQLTLAINSGQLPANAIKKFEKLFTRLDQLLPKEKPALIHGDLWSGNVLCSLQGPVLIDPSVHYGHREADLAMTQLFGGFDNRYLEAYQSAFALEPGFFERMNIYNLYPLLVHVNLFGGYGTQVNSILTRYS